MGALLYVDITGRDIGGYVEDVKRLVLPAGYVLSGAASTRTCGECASA